jgi:energy-converting hydrogenase Eha subunit C
MDIKLLSKLVLLLIFLSFSNISIGQGTPEILYYKFNETGSTVKNLASSPPSGTSKAYINGSLAQGSTGTCGGTALVGSGNLSTTDYVDTKWVTSTSGSWTISFWCKGLDSSTTLYYLFSDINAGSFRCFSGGVAGAGNLLLRGPFTEVLVTGGASKNAKVCTFVYDAGAGYIYAYLNGTLVNSVTQSTISLTSTTSLIISGYNSLNGLNSGGLMDEFRLYSKALTASQVARLAYTGSTTGTLTQSSKCSYTSPSGRHTWNRSGTYNDTIANYYNCDSVITINLTVTGNTSASFTANSCDFYVSPSKKFVWTKTGTYSDVIKNTIGCDSLLTINLTIKNSSTSLLKPTACNSYKSPSGKYTWTKTGKYMDTISNSVGCDSIITINLTIGYANTGSITVNACNSYKSPSGKYTWVNSGTYKDVIVNSMGCDSVLTINLTVGYSNYHTFSVTACNKYISPSGKTDWLVSGTYNDTIPNKKGCDSILTINLTLNKSSFSQIKPNTCGKYTSPSGKYTFPYSISFFDTIPNSVGCDSIILIELIVNKITASTISRTVCKRMVSPSKRYTWTISGKYVDTISNRKGCDSVITINLTVNNATVTVSQKGTKLTALADGAQYQWLNCNTNYSKIAGATGQTYIATAIGKYAVEVTEGLCTDTSECLEIEDLRVDKSTLENQLSVYPNPANWQFTILSSQSLNNASIKISNSIGETILQKNNVFGSSASFDISNHPNGIYFIEITEKENSGRVKLIKY